MNRQSPIRSVKTKVLDYLKSKDEFKGIDIRTTYLNEKVDLPLKRPLLTITRGKISSNRISFHDYIGKSIKDDKFMELKGKELILTYEIHIWNNDNPKFGGEDTIERIKENLFEVFEFYPRFIDSLTVDEFRDGDIFEDPFEEGLFHSRCVLKLRGIWTKEFEYELLEEINTNSKVIIE